MSANAANLEAVIAQFPFTGELVETKAFGNGIINNTYLLTYRIGCMDTLKVVLQRINQTVFPHPDEVMENILAVTEHLKKKIEAAGGDPERETLTVIPAKDGKPYCIDSNGDYWRSYTFVSGASSYDTATPEIFYESAVGFGRFTALLADFPSDKLYETIVNFHNTPKRYEAFEAALNKDVCGRAAGIPDVLDFVTSHKEIAYRFAAENEVSPLPLRVTHNDTKLNNVMMDDRTGKALCVVDLDTVMPGYLMTDFGDAIRFGANTAMEDDPDVSKVSLDLEKYETYCKGFVSACKNDITEREILLLPTGALIITFELAIRFLTDYLQGDVYFKITHEGHNLERTRNQLALAADMLAKWDDMMSITKKAAGLN